MGQKYYKNPVNNGTIPTTYAEHHNGYGAVKVYKVEDKQDGLEGVQAASPETYRIGRACFRLFLFATSNLRSLAFLILF